MYPFRTEFCLNYRDSWQVNVVEPLCFVGENCHLSRKWEPAAALHRACHKSWILLGNMCTWNPNDNWQGSQSNTSSLSLWRGSLSLKDKAIISCYISCPDDFRQAIFEKKSVWCSSQYDVTHACTIRFIRPHAVSTLAGACCKKRVHDRFPLFDLPKKMRHKMCHYTTTNFAIVILDILETMGGC